GKRREVSGLRSPHERRVERAVTDGIDLALRGRAVAVDGEAAHVADEAAGGKRMAGRRRGEILAYELHTDAKPLQARIIERFDAPCAGSVHEHVARPIVGARRQDTAQVPGDGD